MATRKPTLTITVSQEAEEDLKRIWNDNAMLYKSADHADGYVAFLEAGINRLAKDYDEGRAVEGFPEFRFISLRKSKSGHGHYLIYDFDTVAKVVTILRVFHTSMDIQGRLGEQFR